MRFDLERMVRCALLLASGAGAWGCGSPSWERQPGSGDVLTLTVGGNRVDAELALDHLTRQKGLMFREKLPPDAGMLFIWPEAMRQAIWMKNTAIPLSVAFIDDQGKIVQIEDLRPHDERSIRSKNEVRYALEVNQGWFRNNGLEPGAVFDEFRKKLAGIMAR